MKLKNSQLIIGALGDNMDDAGFIPIIAEESEDDSFQLSDDKLLPILALRNMVLFPGVMMPVVVGRKKSLRLVREMYKKGRAIGTVAQIDKNTDDPKLADLFKVGTVAQIVRILEMPDNTTTVILRGRKSFVINEVVSETPYMTASVELRKEITKVPKSKNFTALVEAIKDLAMRMIRMSSNMPQDLLFAIRNIEKEQFIINFIAANIGLALEDRQQLLEIGHIEERAYLLLKMLTQESQMLEIKSSIQSQAMENIDKQQREYFLQQQIKTIQKELGG
ncbi:MAG: LON peptidase substrate-binding domain-containing protein, partial [Paludibacteraceae bacterium]|nr:LON peptidase substrate-binding domain-containing protein [Paludibacteraceae bacterium]